VSDLENKRKTPDSSGKGDRKGKYGSVREIKEEWKQLRDAIAVGAEEVYGFQKARASKKPRITTRC